MLRPLTTPGSPQLKSRSIIGNKEIAGAILAYNAEVESEQAAPPQTFSIRGLDGNFYGPVDLNTLRQWVQEGRVQRETLIRDQAGHEFLAGSWEALFPPMAPPRRGMPAWAIVLIILAILVPVGLLIGAALLFPVFAQAQNGAQMTRERGNLKFIGTAVLMYTADSDDVLPPDMSSARAAQPYLLPYTKDPAVFQPFNPKGGEFIGNPLLSGKSMSTINAPARTPMFYNSIPWPGDVANVLYLDGTVIKKKFSEVEDEAKQNPF